MKLIFTLLGFLFFTFTGFSQTIITTGTSASNFSVAGRTWNIINSTTATAGPLSNGQNVTDYIVVKGFNFSTLPINIAVQSISITFSRSGTGTITDNKISLVLANAIQSFNVATATVWPATNTSVTYNFPTAAVSTLTQADLQNANFGVAIQAQRLAGNNIDATVNYQLSMTLIYSTVAPLIITSFNVAKNGNNHVNIKWATATEDRVKNIYIERSTDGRTFTKLFTIAPQGAKNVYTSYAVTDKTPALGNNYYRLSQVDLDGRLYYFETRLVNVTKKAESFQAFYTGGQIITNISNIPGEYQVTLADISGITIGKKQLTMNGSAAQVEFDAPSRTGIYLVILEGEGLRETTRLSIQK
jgi:hypothetical protein